MRGGYSGLTACSVHLLHYVQAGAIDCGGSAFWHSRQAALVARSPFAPVQIERADSKGESSFLMGDEVVIVSPRGIPPLDASRGVFAGEGAGAAAAAAQGGQGEGEGEEEMSLDGEEREAPGAVKESPEYQAGESHAAACSP